MSSGSSIQPFFQSRLETYLSCAFSWAMMFHPIWQRSVPREFLSSGRPCSDSFHVDFGFIRRTLHFRANICSDSEVQLAFVPRNHNPGLGLRPELASSFGVARKGWARRPLLERLVSHFEGCKHTLSCSKRIDLLTFWLSHYYYFLVEVPKG